MSLPPHIIYAFEFQQRADTSNTDTLDAVTLDDEQQIIAALQEDRFAWVHLDAKDPAANIWLEQYTSYLDHHIRQTLLATESRPQFSQHKDGILLILRGVNLNPDADPEDMVSLRIWIDPHRVITSRLRRLKTMQELANTMQQQDNVPGSATLFLGTIMEMLFNKLEPVIDAMEDVVDGLEEDLLTTPQQQLRTAIARIRRQVIAYRRYLGPQRDAVRQLAACGLSWISETERRAFASCYDQLARYVEDLDALRERTQILQDELNNTLAERMNRNTYVLSIVSAVFLPLGFITGLLGINVGGIPGAESSTAFTIVCISLAALVIAQVLYFRRKGWF